MGFRRRHLNAKCGISNADDQSTLKVPTFQSIPKPLKPTLESICYIAKHKKQEDEKSQVTVIKTF